MSTGDIPPNTEQSKKRGGFRPGSGRPKGSKNKKTLAKDKILQAAVSADVTPLEYMLNVIRDNGAEPKRRDDLAKAAAPYVHARKEAEEGKELKITLAFDRDPAAFSGRVIESVDHTREGRIKRLLSKHAGPVRDSLELILSDTPDDDLEQVYESAVPAVLAANRRGTGERPQLSYVDLEHLQGSTSLDMPDDDARHTLAEAISKVETHNRKLRDKLGISTDTAQDSTQVIDSTVSASR